ncbi:MAG: sugar transferase, partial [Rhodocyclaceae bacterium]|nr:sugar transferase [Rhodocyclaceae bacterium]
NEASWNDRIAMDVWYVDHRSLWTDVRILARTVGAVFAGRGVSAQGEATVAPFVQLPNNEGRDSDRQVEL